MWLMISDAFFSIVHKDCARDELMVRARRQGDIEKVFPGTKVRRDDRTDYLFRAVIKRDDVAKALVGELNRVTYPNFKDSVKDHKLHNAYLRVWSAIADLQPNYRDTLFDRFVPAAPKAVEKPPGKRKYKKRRRSLRRGS